MPTPRKIERYGWVPDLPDHRDHAGWTFAWKLPPLVSFVDMRFHCGPVLDQGQLGSCVAHACMTAFTFELKRQGLPAFLLSRLMLYYEARRIEGTLGSDAGASIRDSFKVLAGTGSAIEKDWPYYISRFKTPPPPNCYVNAQAHKVKKYTTLDNTNEAILKSSLVAGFPFVFGFTVYESFESADVANTGLVPMPTANESVIGGHAVLCVGYDDSTQRFLCQNSWGLNWGQGGFFTIPYAYLTDQNLASDFWSMSLV